MLISDMLLILQYFLFLFVFFIRRTVDAYVASMLLPVACHFGIIIFVMDIFTVWNFGKYYLVTVVLSVLNNSVLKSFQSKNLF